MGVALIGGKALPPGLLKVMPARDDWNRLGPFIPPWFRKALKNIDPTLVLQFIPPVSMVGPGGTSPTTLPLGAWQICRRMRNGWLHKLAIWSLVDRNGNYAPPGQDTLRLLRFARNLWKHRQFHKMEEMMEESIDRIQKAQAAKSKEKLVEEMHRFLSLQGQRQFKNRTFVRSEDSQKVKSG